MAKIKPIDGVKSMSGKVKTNSDMMYITKQGTEDTFSRVIGKRDKEAHPVTNREIETHKKVQEVVAEYQRIKADPEAFARLVAERYSAPIELQCANTYLYFLKSRMDEGKNSVTLKIAKSKSSEESYVKGMLRCQNREEADRLLVDFVETLGYKKLVQAYKNVINK